MELGRRLFLAQSGVSRAFPTPSTEAALPTRDERLGTKRSCQQSPGPPAQLGQD